MDEMGLVTLHDIFPDGHADRVSLAAATVTVMQEDWRLIVGLGDYKRQQDSCPHWPFEVQIRVVQGKVEVVVYDKRRIFALDQDKLAGAIELIEDLPLARIVPLAGAKASVEVLGQATGEYKCG
ncbi:MAG: hypothetical protein BIFFINMI_00944 [Phycisphaerae bacterium]|nr:hypothetical protein [Phycisphaerae bacterium]